MVGEVLTSDKERAKAMPKPSGSCYFVSLSARPSS